MNLKKTINSKELSEDILSELSFQIKLIYREGILPPYFKEILTIYTEILLEKLCEDQTKIV